MWSRLSLCVGLLVGVGCTASTDSPDLTPEQLSDALLTITDVKGNWQETQRQYFSERSNENPSIDPSLWCSKAEGVADRLSTLAGESGAMESSGQTAIRSRSSMTSSKIERLGMNPSVG